MPKLGFNLLVWTASISDAYFPHIERLKKIGYDGIEICMGQEDPAAYQRLNKLTDSRCPMPGFTITCHPPNPPGFLLMKRPSLRSFAISVIAAALLPLGAFAADSGFTPIFNGRNLSGWEGLKEYWSVRDGAITGQTTVDRMLKANTFLVWKGGEPANFELRAQFRLVGNNEKNQANSGVQYRSKVMDPTTYVVGGYQADIDMGRYIGMLYEERGRGILMQPGQKIRVGPPADTGKKGKQKAKIETVATVTTPEQIAAAYKAGGWNEITIIAKGNHLQHFVNGKLTADVTDLDPAKAAKSGVIALQLHQGPPMTIQFKDVRLKVLP